MTKRATILFVSLLVFLALGPPVHAEIPTPADFAACNTKAADAVGETASASPGPSMPPGDRNQPPDARGGGATAAKPRNDVEMPGSPSRRGPGAAGTPDPSASTITGLKDPQLEGLAADRAGDPQYVAAYRSCMRQRGF